MYFERSAGLTHPQPLNRFLQAHFPPPFQCGTFSEHHREGSSDKEITRDVPITLQSERLGRRRWPSPPSEMPYFEIPQLTPHLTFRRWVRCSPHATAYSQQSHSWHPRHHVGGLCSCGGRLRLVEVMGGIAVRGPQSPHDGVLLCEPPTLSRNGVCVCNLFFENPLLKYKKFLER